MNKNIIQIVTKIKKYLLKNYGKKIKGVILYGSYVRGEDTKDSDIDILVLTDNTVDPFEVKRSLNDLLFDILLKKGELVSVIVLPLDYFENYNYPFIINVKKEGVKI